MKSTNNSLKNGMLVILFANLLSLLIGLVNGFVLPKVLSVSSYADIKTYQLYVSFVGITALGYSDGLYLKYGGKKITSISNDDFNISKYNLLISQTIATIIVVIIALFINDFILIFAALSILPLNLASTYKNLFQATGEFSTYSKAINYTSILTFLGTLALLFVFRTDQSKNYLALYILVDYTTLIIIEIFFSKKYQFHNKAIASIQDYKENVKSGFVLMLGNFSNILMTGIDRWFIKLLLSVNSFAYYSFVVSTENLVNVFITPIVTTMYNYICQNTTNYSQIKRIKKMCIMFASVLISSGFLLKFILEHFLTKYLPAANLIFILFLTEVFYVVIKGIYVNLYKALKEQNIYLKQMVAILLFGTLANAIAYVITKSNEGIAFATLISALCWYIVCSLSVKEIAPDIREILLFIPSAFYIIIGLFSPPILGFIFYLIISVIFFIVIDGTDFIYLVKMLFYFAKAK